MSANIRTILNIGVRKPCYSVQLYKSRVSLDPGGTMARGQVESEGSPRLVKTRGRSARELEDCSMCPQDRLISVGPRLYTIPALRTVDGDSLLVLSDPCLTSRAQTAPGLTEFERSMIVLTNHLAVKRRDVENSEPKGLGQGRPSEAQLVHVKNKLATTLPLLFKHSLDYTVYHKDLIFENNFRRTRSVGIAYYVRDMAFLRIVGHMKFSSVYFDVLKITHHVEDSTVRLRWRIRGISALNMIQKFWKVKIWKYQEMTEEFEESWFDGFSTFTVGSDGLVFKHVADKMMPDEELTTSSTSDSLATKLALYLGLLPQQGIFESSTVLDGSVLATQVK